MEDTIEKLQAIREVLRCAYWALDDSEDLTDQDPPVHAIPHTNAAELEEALIACANYAPPDEAWEGPGPLATQVIDQVNNMAAENRRLAKLLAIRTRQVDQCSRNWYLAAKKAMAGDMRDLRLKIDLHEAPPVEVVLS